MGACHRALRLALRGPQGLCNLMRVSRDCYVSLLWKSTVRPSRASGRTGSLPLVVSPSNHEPRGTNCHLSVALRRSMKTQDKLRD